MRERSDLLDPVCEIDLPGMGLRSSEWRDDRDRKGSEDVVDMVREQQEWGMDHRGSEGGIDVRVRPELGVVSVR